LLVERIAKFVRKLDIFLDFYKNFFAVQPINIDERKVINTHIIASEKNRFSHFFLLKAPPHSWRQPLTERHMSLYPPETDVNCSLLSRKNQGEAGECPSNFPTPFGSQCGLRKRIGIARALYNDPKFIVFDEATSVLDVRIENVLM
jgi:hypothetical protein